MCFRAVKVQHRAVTQWAVHLLLLSWEAQLMAQHLPFTEQIDYPNPNTAQNHQQFNSLTLPSSSISRTPVESHCWPWHRRGGLCDTSAIQLQAANAKDGGRQPHFQPCFSLYSSFSIACTFLALLIRNGVCLARYSFL